LRKNSLEEVFIELGAQQTKREQEFFSIQAGDKMHQLEKKKPGFCTSFSGFAKNAWQMWACKGWKSGFFVHPCFLAISLSIVVGSIFLVVKLVPKGIDFG